MKIPTHVSALLETLTTYEQARACIYDCFSRPGVTREEVDFIYEHTHKLLEQERGITNRKIRAILIQLGDEMIYLDETGYPRFKDMS